MILYHGSPIPDLTWLAPKLDKRKGVRGVFTSPSFYHAAIFGILPDSSKASLSYSLSDNSYCKGVCFTSEQPLEKGYVYILNEKSVDKSMVNLDGEVILDYCCEVQSVIPIYLKDLTWWEIVLL